MLPYNQFKQFHDLVKICIERAEELYGPLPHIAVRLDLKGKSAGEAGRDARGQYFMRFNREAITKHWEDMVNNTIPHELAHVITIVKYGTCRHDADWRHVTRSLGGSADRCHRYELTPAKTKTRFRFKYVTPKGIELLIGSKHHNMIQSYSESWSPITVRKTGEVVTKKYFQEKVAI